MQKTDQAWKQVLLLSTRTACISMSRPLTQEEQKHIWAQSQLCFPAHGLFAFTSSRKNRASICKYIVNAIDMFSACQGMCPPSSTSIILPTCKHKCIEIFQRCSRPERRADRLWCGSDGGCGTSVQIDLTTNSFNLISKRDFRDSQSRCSLGNQSSVLCPRKALMIHSLSANPSLSTFAMCAHTALCLTIGSTSVSGQSWSPDSALHGLAASFISASQCCTASSLFSCS
mmetsp:Transcript_151684/g.265046  ORF Transcript_151684/g.265046 Transcript_151684/m.265046 type:complete len:229 (-) Transcript_151684:202-888(-)